MEEKILNEFRTKNVAPGEGLQIQIFLSLTPTAERDAAIERLISRGVLDRRGDRLVLVKTA